MLQVKSDKVIHLKADFISNHLTSSMSDIIATSQAATSAGRRGCITDTTPARTVVECRGELMANNKERRLSGVSATANGVSTSAGKSV